MKTVKFNEDFYLEFTAHGNNRSDYEERLIGLGLRFDKKEIDANTCLFAVKATMSKYFIGQLNDFLNP